MQGPWWDARAVQFSANASAPAAPTSSDTNSTNALIPAAPTTTRGTSSANASAAGQAAEH